MMNPSNFFGSAFHVGLLMALASFGPPEMPIAVTISLGLATFPDERAPDAEGLLRLADQNLLRAKSDGRNRYRD